MSNKEKEKETIGDYLNVEQTEMQRAISGFVPCIENFMNILTKDLEPRVAFVTKLGFVEILIQRLGLDNEPQKKGEENETNND